MSTVVIPVGFASLDEGGDPKTQPPGTMLVAENCAMDKQRRLIKRDGTRNLSRNIVAVGADLTAAKRLYAIGDELALTDGSKLYSYSAANDGWTDTGRLAEVGLTWNSLVDLATGVRTSDIGLVTLNCDWVVHAWSNGDPTGGNLGSVYYQVYDRAADAIIVPPTLVSGSTTAVRSVRVIVSGGNYVILWRDSGSIYCSFNGATATTLVSDGRTLGTSNAFDACLIGSTFVIAYELASGTNRIQLRSYSFAGPPVQQAAAVVTGETGTNFQSISIEGASGETLYIAYANNADGVMFATANPATLAQVVAPTTVDSTGGAPRTAYVARLTSTSCVLAYSLSSLGTTSDIYAVTTVVVSNAGAISGKRLTFGVSMLSRPFVLGGIAYMFLADSFDSILSEVLPNSYLVAIETNTLASSHTWPHRYVGKVDLLTAGQWPTGLCATGALASSTEYVFGLPTQGSPSLSFRGAVRQGVNLVSVTVGDGLPADMWRGVDLAGELYVAAGVLQAYDGRQPFDYGFSRSATFCTTDFTYANLGSMSNGNYLYSVVPEYRSAAGILHRGPTLPAFEATLAISPDGSGKVTVPIVPPALSNKMSSARGPLGEDPNTVLLAIHRSVVDGSLLYRETWEPQFNVVYGSYETAPINFVDVRSDADITSGAVSGGELDARPLEYTTGGELDDYQPPSFVTVTRWQGRLVGLDGTLRRFWISKDSFSNQGVAPGFHPNLIFLFDVPMTAAWEMDANLVFFSDDALWVVAGEGPGPNGQPAYPAPTKVQTDVGCTNPRSLVTTPEGVMFQSRRGIELLDRGFTVTWRGKEIETTLAAFPNITSAVLVAAKHEVRFTANNDAGTAGVVLVWDYISKTWFTRKYTDTNATPNVVSTPIADAVLWRGEYAYVTPTGHVAVEDPTTKLDGGTVWVNRDVQFAWLSPGGPIAWQRAKDVMPLGTNVTNHDLEVSLARDYSASWEKVATFAAQTLATTIGPLARARVTFTTQKVQSVRARLRDLTPTTGNVSTGEGPIWEAMALRVGVKAGLPKTAASQQE